MERWLKRNATTFMIGGIFLFFSILLYLTMCTMPCEYRHHRIHRDVQEHSHNKKNKPAVKFDYQHQAFLVVLVITGPKYFERRETIRQTWLSHTAKDVRHFFPIGIEALSAEEIGTLEYENSIHNDLVLLGNVIDSYENLTGKVLESMKWLDKNVDFKFVLKADDDTYARVDVIRSELNSKEEMDNLYWGFFDGRARVKRSGKWQEPDWILCNTYLPHARGGGYVLSSNLVHFLANSAGYLKKFKSEDVSMGAWLAAVEVSRLHDPRFDTEFVSRGCNNAYIVTHKQSIADMRNKHQTLQRKGQLCQTEFRVRISYNYNWKVLPSECCIRNDSSVP